jgi:hypothetical protein
MSKIAWPCWSSGQCTSRIQSRHLSADSVCNDLDPRGALAKFGHWAIEIVKRAGDAAGSELLRVGGLSSELFAWLNRHRRLAKNFEASMASAEAWLYTASVHLLIRRLA